MIRLAISGCQSFEVDDREIRRGQLSYTVDTVAEICAENPDAEVIFIIGSDSLADIGRWHQPQRLLSLALPAVVQRGGEPAIDFSVLEGLVDPQRLKQIRDHVIEMPIIEVSSSELRSRLANRRSIRFRTPRAVEAMIEAKGLYAN
jgi:nicotinate-nucleotide adenylyltransferase